MKKLLVTAPALSCVHEERGEGGGVGVISYLLNHPSLYKLDLKVPRIHFLEKITNLWACN